MSGMFKNPLTGAVIVSKTIDHFVTSADARLSLQSNRESIDYMRSRDSQMFDLANQQMSFQSDENRKDRELAEWSTRRQADMLAFSNYDQAMAQQAALSRMEDMERERNAMMESIAEEERRSREYQLSQERELRERMADADRHADMVKTGAILSSRERMQQQSLEASERMQKQNLEANERMQKQNLEANERMQKQNLEANERMHERSLETSERMQKQSLETRERMQQQQISHEDRLMSRQLAVQQNIAEQQDKLQRYLADRNIQSAQEIARFTALANRETQILLARETAQNMLQDRLVQDAMKDFPLDIAPLVLLGEKKDSLDGLLRFSVGKNCNTDISAVYHDVKRYAANPEPLKIFITPIRLSSDIKNREQFSKQIWDSIYQNMEGFFTENYDRRGDHPVVVYPSAWKEQAAVGLHACETLHFFLHDVPCLVIEPKFDGTAFRMLVSAWQLGYTTTDHVRTEMKFDINLDLEVIKAAYDRSVKSLSLLESLNMDSSSEMIDKKRNLEDNIKRYEAIGLGSGEAEERIDEVSALGIYNLFHIEPQQDLKVPAKLLSDIICLNLGVLVDSHHLLSTDAEPIFPTLFKKWFPNLYDVREIRQLVYNCYEKIMISLRNQDSNVVTVSGRRQMERTREMQMTNLKKTLELIDESEINDNVEDKVVKYCNEKYGRTFENSDDMWFYVIDNMDASDLDFFMEILPNISDRIRYKKIERKMSTIRNR